MGMICCHVPSTGWPSATGMNNPQEPTWGSWAGRYGPNKDIEPGAAPVLYWFQLERRPDGVHFRPHLVDNWSGVGLQVVAVDVTGDGVPDILTASKLGSVLFVTKRGSVATR